MSVINLAQVIKRAEVLVLMCVCVCLSVTTLTVAAGT